MMSMEIRDLETFLLIVKTGSFTEAAKTLHLTQPGISRRIRQLEEELGCKLFEKVGNGLIVTSGGQDLLPYAESVMQSVATLKRAFELRTGRVTNVTITFSSTLAGTQFTARFKELKREFGHVDQFQLRMLNDGDLCLSLMQGETDVGVRFFSDGNPNLVYHRLWEDPFVLVRAGDSQWFTSTEPVTVEKLSTVPWMVLTADNVDPLEVVNQLTEETCARLGIERRQKVECFGFGVTQSMVEADIGIAFLPWMRVREHVHDGRLQVIELLETPMLQLYGVHRKNEVHADLMAEIVNFLAWGLREQKA